MQNLETNNGNKFKIFQENFKKFSDKFSKKILFEYYKNLNKINFNSLSKFLKFKFV